MTISVIHGNLHYSNVCKNNPFCTTTCHIPCATSTSWAVAYPHFHRCSPYSNCAAQTALPLPKSVCPLISLRSCKRRTSSVFGASAMVCGPAPASVSVSHCATGKHKNIGCATKYLLASLLNEGVSRVSSFNSNTYVTLSVSK